MNLIQRILCVSPSGHPLNGIFDWLYSAMVDPHAMPRGVSAKSDPRAVLSILLRKHPWLAPSATVASGIGLTIAIVLRLDFFAFGAAACLFVTSYTWGYATRSQKRGYWPLLNHLQRWQYAETWDSLASSREAAAWAACGKFEEGEIRSSAAEAVRNLLELASIGVRDDVLEIGCGVGRIGLELAPHCHSWIGSDISANMLAHAADRLRGVGNIGLQHLRRAGLSELADHSVDVVYSTNMLAHLDEIDRWHYVQEAFRVLRPGGRIFLDNIDVESDEGWAMFASGNPLDQEPERPPYMPRFSTAAELMTYAMRAGFDQVGSHHRPPVVIMTAVKPG